MFEMIKKFKYSQFLIFALTMTVLTFYYDFFDVSAINNMRELVLLGSPDFTAQFTQYITENNIILPPIIFWTILGVLAYFIYYSLNILYYFAYNNAVVGLFYTNKTKHNLEPPRFRKRIIFHLALVVIYLVIIGMFISILIPLSNVVKNVIAEQGNNEIYFYLSIAATSIYWVFISSLFGVFLSLLKVEKEEVDLSEEHDAAPCN